MDRELSLPTPAERDTILGLLHDTRRILERVIQRAGYESGTPASPAAGTCLMASVLLKTTLDKFGDCSMSVRGGDGMTEGLRLPSGAWGAHYWLEGQTASGAAILCDITADQFGYEPVVLLDASASWKHYRSGDPAEVDRHAAEVFSSLLAEERGDAPAQEGKPSV